MFYHFLDFWRFSGHMQLCVNSGILWTQFDLFLFITEILTEANAKTSKKR